MRVFLLVLDSVGCGAMPDASQYGDEGSNTLKHTAIAAGGLKLPVFEKLGLGNICEIKGVSKVDNPESLWGKMAKKSCGKDTQTGHWEIAGYIANESFRTYPEGFPDELVAELEKATKTRFLGNKPASGTVIIEELGERHLETGYPILYTSADPVLQIAAHEEKIPLEKLYQICTGAFEIAKKWQIARVIARPFIGSPGKFQRTYNRKDFSVPPGGTTILDILSKHGIEVIGVGKIWDIFAGRGITRSIHTEGNDDGARVTIELAQTASSPCLIFVNFVDFDMLYGHRRNPAGYAQALEKIDSQLGSLKNILKEGDLVIVTADHGNDPTFKGTDHTREYVPLMIFGPACKITGQLGCRSTFADVGETILSFFGIPCTGNGKAIKLS